MPTKNPHSLTEPDRLHWLVTHNKAQRVTLGAYKFWINPESIEFLTEWLYAEAPTLGGYGVWDFGVKPYEFTLEGTTGTMGEFDLDDKTGLALSRPRFNTPNKMTTLSIPGRTKWNVRVLRVKDRISQQKPHMYYYAIDLKVYDEAKASYTKIYTAASVTNSITGPLVPGKAPVNQSLQHDLIRRTLTP